ncbi:hypothetical protein A2524_03650 [Candidatus Wolfebacteria bacterium RIFOXYD12_FULL_48_21]|uniref:Lipoprotein n=1 Tax=Candidatus Wolfebacteria bacterium RIFOXYD1_FULL_48_65 TaxID=1802561 RepID=A0A1F8DYQ3_9BACT|nr:MAG: hypothetical protein A2610_00190 [Candidatus Wolfebacteria bacterium RIFOXYD1_FULL_48_65]OGM95147.1 MAG: hypothetical protein A2524_03650 [Candidatus Wolfebacteria bacterium RIFOXYD12_FULL_48_21]OGM95760.1 MAG: hypothetical protein A2532_03545 [Candidatus Wolfebacteria bacterium RIFOXYD2_FULL_48_11]
MKKTAIAALAALCLLCGCGVKGVTIYTAVPVEHKQDYRQEYTHGGKNSFYYSSYLMVVNASQYKIRLVQNGTELPMFYLPKQSVDIKIKNHVHGEEVVHMLVVAYSRYGNRVIGTTEKVFRFNGNGQQQVEQWVLKDWMFD